LVKAARRGLGSKGGLICAGSVDSPARIAELKAAGCDSFTIGSAAFDGSFSPRKGRLSSQLQDILAAC
jgi:putative N-acetylmannosamine-6-phosphate epimerase